MQSGQLVGPRSPDDAWPLACYLAPRVLGDAWGAWVLVSLFGALQVTWVRGAWVLVPLFDPRVASHSLPSGVVPPCTDLGVAYGACHPDCLECFGLPFDWLVVRVVTHGCASITVFLIVPMRVSTFSGLKSPLAVWRRPASRRNVDSRVRVPQSAARSLTPS